MPGGIPVPGASGRNAATDREAPLFAEADPANRLFRTGISACPTPLLPRIAPDDKVYSAAMLLIN